MRRALVISTYFDANVTIGSARMAGLARYLREYGWEPTILSPTIPGEPALPREDVEIVEYEDLFARAKRLLGKQPTESFSLGDTEAGTSLRGRARGLAVGSVQYLAMPDVFVGWYPTGRRALRRLHDHGRRFDVVLSSSNPKTPHLLGRSAHRIFGVPWVADLRDFWTIDHYYRFGWPRKPIERRLERSVLGEADALVTVSPQYADRLATFLGRNVRSIFNGFDPADVNDPPVPLTDKLTFTYTGSLALGKRDPTRFLEALRRLADRGSISLDDIDVRFYGRHEPALAELVRRLGIEDSVRQLGYVPRTEALARQRESHALLLFFWDHPLEAGVITGKLEYFAARRPILALGGPGGAMEDLLAETGAGAYVRARDETRLDNVLLEWYRDYRELGAVQYRGNESAVAQLDQREIARAFAEIFDDVTKP